MDHHVHRNARLGPSVLNFDGWYYRWRKQYGGMGTDQLKELKRLQKENERLRKAVSDLTLDKLILSEAAKGNF
ncbi:transposase [Roseibium sp. TrichSKD4]|nr:transposase [Roseibium sp. TrichSKD4]